MAAGLLDRLVAEDGQLDVEAFEHAVRAGRPVAICRCGAPMIGRIDVTRRITFYVAECQEPTCRDEITSPGGRLLQAVKPMARATDLVRRRPVTRRSRAGQVDPRQRAEWSARDRARLGEKDDD